MANKLFIVALLGVVVSLDLASCCSSGGGGGGGGGMPRSNSGRPFGVDINDNVEVYPNYDRRHDAVGVGLEVRPNSEIDVRLTGGVGVGDALNGRFRPQGDIEVEMRPNDRYQLNVGAGVDANGNPRGHVGVQIPFRRRRSGETAYLDEETSLILFNAFNLDKDDKLDVIDWSSAGGKVVSFSDLISAHDMDGDEKLSLEEFLQIPILPGLGLDLDRFLQDNEGTPAPEQD